MIHNYEKKDKKEFLIAQEIELAKLLSGNNKNVRHNALKNLKHWFCTRSQAVPFTDNDFQRLWKGLFFSMWMSDKPLVQEECAENISDLLHLPTYELSLQFFKAGLTILINEWFGIDQLRLDKFLMLVRRFLRHMLIVLKEKGFTKQNIEKFNDVISNTVLSTTEKVPLGLFMHFNEIFLEELSKVTEGHIHSDSVTGILRPFIKKLVCTDDGRQVGHIRRNVFTYLIRQTNLGLEYEEKYEAWRKLGFPDSINSLQKNVHEIQEEISMDETKNFNTKVKSLDPRAGRVDVELPQLKFNSKKLSEMLMDYKFDNNSTKRGRSMMNILSKQFAMLANGKYPLGLTKLELRKKNEPDTNTRKAVNKLIKFELKLRDKDMKRKRSKSIKEDDKQDLEDSPKLKRAKILNNENDNVLLPQKDSKGPIIQKKKKINKGKVNNYIIEIQGSDKVRSNKKNSYSTMIQGKANEDEKETQGKGQKINKIPNSKRANKTNRTGKGEKKNNPKSVNGDIECIFKRNSGTWFVIDVSNQLEKNVLPNKIGAPEYIFDRVSLENSNVHSFEQDKLKSSSVHSSVDTAKFNSFNISCEKMFNCGMSNKMVSSKKVMKPITLFESPPRGRALFPRTEWDEALQEGEYEVFIPSKNYLKKMQALTKKNGQVVVVPSQNNQVKSRRSLDPDLTKTIHSSTSGSTKKVKINTKLNRSQEIYEHHMQIINSPGMPHDPNKKPVKPVLKSPARANSINPFYDKQLNIW